MSKGLYHMGTRGPTMIMITMIIMTATIGITMVTMAIAFLVPIIPMAKRFTRIKALTYAVMPMVSEKKLIWL
jgi:predicted RNA polymerase sigma factor